MPHRIMFMRDNIRKFHDEKGDKLYETALQSLNRGRESRANENGRGNGRPAQKAMRLMFQSAMEALDAGKESVARQRLGLSAGAAFDQAMFKEKKGKNVSSLQMALSLLVS